MKPELKGKPDIKALNELGVWFGEHNRFDCAVSVFASSLQMDPQQKDFPHVAFMFGAALYMTGDTKEAIPALQEAEKLGYHDIKLHVILATALDRSQARADAENEWRKALEIDPEFAEALDHLSSDLIADGNFGSVIQLLDTPRAAPLRSIQQDVNLGTAYSRSGKPGDAVRVLRDAVNTYPDSMPLAQQLADLLTQQGKQKEASDVLENARKRQAGAAQPAH